jgi:hypothetical protein
LGGNKAFYRSQPGFTERFRKFFARFETDVDFGYVRGCNFLFCFRAEPVPGYIMIFCFASIVLLWIFESSNPISIWILYYCYHLYYIITHRKVIMNQYFKRYIDSYFEE